MKKLFLTLLVVAAGIVNASAADDLYLRSDYAGDNHWNDDTYKFNFVETNSNNEDVYVYTIDATGIATSDIWFRLHISGWGAQICPFTSNGSYTFKFENGQNETYGAKYERTYFQGDQLSFGISHSTIKASAYRITVYRGNNEINYENENCKVMWIKVEIVSMPVTIPSSSFATLTSGRALNFSGSGVTAYTATDSGNGSATLVPATQPAAATPMLLKATAGTYNIPVVETQYGTDNPSQNAFKAGTGAALASEADGCKNYILNSGAFYLANNQTVATNKAYLQLAASGTASEDSKANLIFPNGETTAISKVFGNDGESNVYYNLQGMKVANPTKGMYILNGKKYVVK